MLSFSDLISLLNKKKAKYEIIEHSTPVLTVKDAVQYFDITKAVPILIVDTERGLYAFYKSPENKNFSLELIKREFKFNKVKLASKEKIEKETGYSIGSIPLVGHNLPCFFDASILKHSYIYGGTGDAYHTLKIFPGDILRINRIEQVIPSLFFD